VLTILARGQLQLWRAPRPETGRATEVRQFVWTRGAATCAAFSPDGAFCVTGTDDRHVLVWPMPARCRDTAGRPALVESPLKSRLTVEKFIDSANRQVRVWAEVDNKHGLLVPGATATLVVLPDAR
jgi:hypothetical protein